MNKKIILTLIVVGLAAGYLISEYQAKDTEVKDQQEVLVEATVEGTVTNVDRSQLMLDGPTLLTVATDEGLSETVAVPSMGIKLCVANESIADTAELAVGDVVMVRGERDEEGRIVPCAEEGDSLIIHGKVLDQTYGYEFSYRKGPYGYITLEDTESKHSDYVTGVTLFNASEYEEYKASVDAREGPPAMRLRVYENPQKQFATAWVQQNQSEVNYNLKQGAESEEVVGGANAVRFRTDGLFTTDVYVVASGKHIYVLMGDYLEAKSLIRQDFSDLVDSFTFVPTPEQVGGSAKINPQVVCESALSYMSFPSGEEADKFLAGCTNGEHPEVIERYIRDSGLNGAVI